MDNEWNTIFLKAASEAGLQNIELEGPLGAAERKTFGKAVTQFVNDIRENHTSLGERSKGKVLFALQVTYISSLVILALLGQYLDEIPYSNFISDTSLILLYLFVGIFVFVNFLPAKKPFPIFSYTDLMIVFASGVVILVATAKTIGHMVNQIKRDGLDY